MLEEPAPAEATSSQEATIVSGEIISEAATSGKVTVAYSLDGNEWKNVGEVSLGAFGDISFPLPSQIRDFEHLQVSVQGDALAAPERVYLDAIWVEAQYEQMAEEAKPKAKELPGFLRDLPQQVLSYDTIFFPSFVPETATDTQMVAIETVAPMGESWGIRVDIPESLLPPDGINVSNFYTRLLELDDLPSTIEPTFSLPSASQVIINVPQVNQARPGRYTLETYLVRDGVAYIGTYRFLWGTLAINIDRTVAKALGSTLFQLTTLDQGGHIACDANLQLILESPSGDVHTLLTQGNEQGDGYNFIRRGEECGPDTHTDSADYYVRYTPLELGTYKITLTDPDKEQSLSSTFEVSDGPVFDVERISTSRTTTSIDGQYFVRLEVTPSTPFEGRVVETVPEDVRVVSSPDYTLSRLPTGERQIIWEKKLPIAEMTELAYQYIPPKVSPRFYLFGPLTFEADGTKVFSEKRQWQILNDSTPPKTEEEIAPEEEEEKEKLKLPEPKLPERITFTSTGFMFSPALDGVEEEYDATGPENQCAVSPFDQVFSPG